MRLKSIEIRKDLTDQWKTHVPGFVIQTAIKNKQNHFEVLRVIATVASA